MKNRLWIFMLGLLTLVNAEERTPLPESDTFWIWIALFSLSIIAIIILFISSKQALKMKKSHESMIQKQLEMEKNQNILLTNMSENIHNIAKQTLEKTNETIEKIQQDNNKDEDSENRLLTVTNDLIDFLKLKSKKIQINNEPFNINNVLNEVSGSICTQFSGKSTELIFDIDNNVPRFIVGDSLHLGQILRSILDHIMKHSSGDEVKLEISMFNTFDNKIELQFKFTDTGGGISTEEVEALFRPYYDEDEDVYVGFGLFVAYELVSMMKGELSVQSVLDKGSTFSLTLPFDIATAENKRTYRLPEKIFIAKKVFIVDNNHNSALAIKKMFAYFKHEVRVITKDEFLRMIPNLKSYDIVVFNESLFTTKLVRYLHTIKLKKELKVIALNALINSNKNNFVNKIVDLHLFKPLNQERILEMIINMYDIKIPFGGIKSDNKREVSQVKTHKGDIVTTPHVTQEHFKDFSGKNILIVEDNLINQKVITNILNRSEMNISLANNGKEALALVKEEKIAFDFVLMDINMPIMDGYTATQMIRLDGKFNTLPIVAFTALVLDSEIQKMFYSGVNAFLAKPLNIGKLYTVLAMYLSTVPMNKTLSERIEDKAYAPYASYANLDIKKGIAHANNNEALYLEVINEFNNAYGKSDALFTKLVTEQRYEEIQILCVDLKGLTGAIGAYSLYDLVVEIHQCLLYNKKELLPTYIEKYRFEIKELSRSINQTIAI